jgi:hypothetical protein
MSISENPYTYPDRAGNAIRTFNHVSQSPREGWQYPGDAYAALGNLAYLTGMLGQAIEQATRPVEWTVERGQLRMDGGMDQSSALNGMRRACTVAVDTAERLAEAVQHLHNTTSPMGATLTDDDAAEHTDAGFCRDCG